MILKIRCYKSEGNLPAPEHVVECDRYTSKEYDGIDGDDDTRWFWKDGKKGEEVKKILVTFAEGKTARQFFLSNAVVYVMNNEGKTIDTIYAI